MAKRNTKSIRSSKIANTVVRDVKEVGESVARSIRRALPRGRKSLVSEISKLANSNTRSKSTRSRRKAAKSPVRRAKVSVLRRVSSKRKKPTSRKRAA